MSIFFIKKICSYYFGKRLITVCCDNDGSDDPGVTTVTRQRTRAASHSVDVRPFQSTVKDQHVETPLLGLTVKRSCR